MNADVCNFFYNHYKLPTKKSKFLAICASKKKMYHIKRLEMLRHLLLIFIRKAAINSALILIFVLLSLHGCNQVDLKKELQILF